jgi:hypothetical protein
MASDIAGFVYFSDGSFASLLKEGATSETVTSLQTGGTGLNQAAGIEIGQAYEGKKAVAASVKVLTDDDTSAAFCHAYFLSPKGEVMCPVQGGGYQSTGVPNLKKPVMMVPGVTLQAMFDTAADGDGMASLAVYCKDGTSDVFAIKASDGVATAMTSVKTGQTIGNSLPGKVIQCAYATYSSTKGVNDNGAGVSAFFIESSDGQLKAMYPPSQARASSQAVPYISFPNGVKIQQNDTLSVTSGN